MEKRVSERMPSNFNARLFYGNMVYTGVVTNLSEKGMFISTKRNFPVKSVFVTAILVDDDSINIPVKIRRNGKSGSPSGYSDDYGMGVELLETSQEYLELVSSYKSSNNMPFI